MEYARDLLSGIEINSSAGQRGRHYLCPSCGGRVNYRAGAKRVAHFAHKQGAGSKLCELYTPGSGIAGGPDTAALARILPLQFFLGDDGAWQLFVEFSAVDLDEWGSATYGTFSSSRVRLSHSTSGIDHGFSPMDLWPGSGRNALPLPPSTDSSEAQASGAWPNAVNRRRWAQTVPGMEGKGTIFARYRGGAFRRYEPQTTPVNWGDTVVLLRNTSTSIPLELPAQRLPPVSMGKSTWFAWQVTLPRSRTISAEAWLRSFGVTVEAPAARPQIITPAHAYSADGVPLYPVGGEIAVLSGTKPVDALRGDDAGQRHFIGSFAANSMLGMRTAEPVASVFIAHLTGIPFIEFTSAHLQIASPAPMWSVKCGDHSLNAFDNLQVSLSPAELCVDDQGSPLRVDVHIDSSPGISESLLNAESAAANQWIAERLDRATHITVDAGNLGVITVAIQQASPAPPDPPVEVPVDPPASANAVRPRHWARAYATASANDPTAIIPHWQIRDSPLSPTKAGRP